MALPAWQERLAILFEKGWTHEQVAASTGLKMTSLRTAACAIRRATGKNYLPPVKRPDGMKLAPMARADLPERLKKRDAAIEGWFAGGMTREQVAAKLGISPKTMIGRLQRVRERLGHDLPGQGAKGADVLYRRMRDPHELRTGTKAHQILKLFEDGKTRDEIQCAMGMEDNAFNAMLTWVRKRLGHDLPGHGAKRTGSNSFHKGHGLLGNQGPTPPAKLEKRHEKLDALETAERCPVCHLLLPHYDCIRPRGRASRTDLGPRF